MHIWYILVQNLKVAKGLKEDMFLPAVPSCPQPLFPRDWFSGFSLPSGISYAYTTVT